MPTYVALIRAIGPMTHRQMPLGRLVEACTAAGLERVVNYLATGNLLVRSAHGAEAVRGVVGSAVRAFGLPNAVFIRDADELAAAVASNPFPELAAERPAAFIVGFFDAAPDPARLPAPPADERLALAGRELFVAYGAGVSTSRLTPGVLERKLGAPMTFRNWNTVTQLARRAAALSEEN